MAYPNMGNLVLAAAGKVSAATPPVVTSPVNLGAASVTRTGAGITVINLNEAIDFTQRFCVPYTNQAAGGKVGLDNAIQTDLTIGVLAFDLAVPAAADVAYEFICFRLIIL